MRVDTLAALSRIESLASLSQPAKERLGEISGLQRLGRGSTLFREGEHAHFVYALIEGRVALISGPDDDETVADFLGAGDVVLIPPALLGVPYMATGRATTDVLVLLIPAMEFGKLIESDLSCAIAASRILSAHWRLLFKHLKQTKTRDADTRVMQYLLDKAGGGDGAAIVRLPGSKRQLAAHLGISPETLSRSFKRLSKYGIETDGAEIRIASLSRLGALVRREPQRITDPS